MGGEEWVEAYISFLSDAKRHSSPLFLVLNHSFYF